MPSVASIEDLRAVQVDLHAARVENEEAYARLAAMFKKHRKVGYKNICKMFLGEATPEKLKGLE